AVARVGGIGEAEEAHELVDVERCGADDLGEPPGAEAPRELHLRQPLLRVGEAFGEPGAVGRRREDMRNAVRAADDLDRLGGRTTALGRLAEAGRRERPLRDRQAGPQPQHHADERRQRQLDREREENEQPAPEKANHDVTPRITCTAWWSNRALPGKWS